MWARKQIYRLASHKFRFEKYFFSSDGSLLGKVGDMAQALKFADKSGFNTLRRPLATGNANRVRIANRADNRLKEMVMFGSNTYLGLTTHPRVKEAAQKAIDEYGVGAGGVPLLSGTHKLQDQLEERVAQLKDCEAAMLFTSGYLANIGCVAGLMREGDCIVNDRLNHASIIDGCKLSGAKYVTFKHNSMNGLERKLTNLSNGYAGRILVATDGVYSMEGDIARLDGIIPIAKRLGALLMIDDAHATGVIGKNGKGTKSHYGITDGVDIVVGTLSKAVGVVGGFVASTKEIIDYLRIYSRSNMYSTALPPSVCAAAIEAINVMEEEPHLIENLWHNINYIKSALNQLGFNTGRSETAIIPIFVEDEESLVLMQRDVHERGLFVNSITSPVVPPNESRFRVSVMASHTKEDMDFLLDVMEELGRKYKVIS
jgi:8-amino-7-oxononanoate synthase